MTIPSDSENYDGNNELSDSPPSSSSSPMILYSPPTIWGLLRGAGINLLLPFVNGLMLGFGELFANELAFRFGWAGTKVSIVAVVGEAGASTAPTVEPSLDRALSTTKLTRTVGLSKRPVDEACRPGCGDAGRSSREETARWGRIRCIYQYGMRCKEHLEENCRSHEARRIHGTSRSIVAGTASNVMSITKRQGLVRRECMDWWKVIYLCIG